MTINTSTETLRSFAQIARRLPPLRGGKPVSASTVSRWTTRGVRSRGGRTIRLECIRIGGTCCSSDQALVRFFSALSEDEARTDGPAVLIGGETITTRDDA